jgi:hypothetical protein
MEHAPAPPTSASAAALDPAGGPAAEDARREQYFEGVEADFDAEPSDPRWSRTTASEFQSSVARSDILRKALESIDCRSSTCRIELKDDPSPQFREQIQELARDVAPVVPSMKGHRFTKPDGTTSMVLYWSKGS